MATSSQTWNDQGTPPTLASINVGDIVTVTGKYASLAALKRIAGKVTGGYTTAKKFAVSVNALKGPHAVDVKRTA